MIPRNRLLRRRRSRSENSSRSKSSWLFSRITRFFSSLACCFHKAATIIAPIEEDEYGSGSFNEETFIASSARVNCKSDSQLGDVESETEPVKPALESSSTNQHDDWDIEKTPSYSDQIEDPKSSSSCKEIERVNSKCTSSVDEVYSGKDSASQLQKEVPENKSKLRFLNNGRLVLPKEDDDDDYDIALDISRQVVANVVRSFQKVKKPCPQISEETFVASSARVNCKSDNELGDAESETEPVKPALESSSTDQHDDWDIEKTPSYSDQIEDPKSSSSCKENERVNSKCTSMSVDEVDSGKDSASQLQKEVPENKSKLRFLNNGRLVLPKEDDDDDYDIALDISRQVVANVVRSFEKVKKPCPQTNEGISASWIPGAAENVISTKNYFYMFLPLGEVTDLQRQSQHLSLQVNNVFTEGNEDENYYAEIIEEDYDDVELNHIFIQHRCHSAYPSVSRKIQEDDDEMLDEDVKIAPPQCSMVQMLY